MTPFEVICAGEGIGLTGIAVMLMTRSGRQAFTRMLLQTRYLLVELPLRLGTGRKRPDYARIARLERELGIRR